MAEISTMSLRQEILARARSQIGVAFRPRGRRPFAALDCAALAAYSIGAEEALEQIPANYTLRGNHTDTIAALARKLGLSLVENCRAVQPADLLVARTAPCQLHMAICMEEGFVHADASLARVVLTPGACPWPIIACWRLKETS